MQVSNLFLLGEREQFALLQLQEVRCRRRFDDALEKIFAVRMAHVVAILQSLRCRFTLGDEGARWTTK